MERQGRLAEMGPVDPRTVPYYKYPEHFFFFTFVKATGKWKRKGVHNNNIGRVHSVIPKQQERYCLRILLHHTSGAMKYEDLYVVNGHQHPNAFEAAKAMGLIRNPEHFDAAMRDAAFFKIPRALRTVFATLLAFDEPQIVQAHWDVWKAKMSEDYVNRGRTVADAEVLAYFDILEMCLPMNIRLESLIMTQYVRPAPMQDNAVDHVTIGEEMYRKLNPKQKEAVDAVLSGQERLIYLDGPGGSGKTFTYECRGGQLPS